MFSAIVSKKKFDLYIDSSNKQYIHINYCQYICTACYTAWLKKVIIEPLLHVNLQGLTYVSSTCAPVITSYNLLFIGAEVNIIT